MWTIHDFLGYGLVSSCQHQGYKAYPPCGSSTVSRWSKELGEGFFFKEADGGCEGTTLIEHT
jgi:hypothetical protein